jgi:tRNA (guanine-N7-)-methyltransferase
MEDETDTISTELRSFGRRRGRKPSARQTKLWEEVLPHVRFSPANLRTENAIWLEIGFGGGEHLVWQAEHNSDVQLLGCEPFEDGVIKVLAEIEQRKLSNILIHPDDARDALRQLPDNSIDRAFVLFPDPWPKRKHLKRRLVNPSLLQTLGRVLKMGAELRIGTDIPDYARTILMSFQGEPRFSWQVERARDWTERPSDWPQTRYEAKAVREGRRSCYLHFLKTS